jgi:hypothetical protein
MLHRRDRWLALGLALLVGGATLAAGGCGDDPAKPGHAGAKTVPRTHEARRPAPEILQEVLQTELKTRSLWLPETILDRAGRREAAAQAIPAFRKMNSLVQELGEGTDPLGRALAEQMEPQVILRLAGLAVFGDKGTSADLEKLARSADPKEAVRGRAALMMAAWIMSSQDAGPQGTLLADAETLAAENPTSEPLTKILAKMSELGAASPELSDRAQAIASSMRTPTAEAIRAGMAAQRTLR